MTQMNANILKQAKLCILRFPHLFWWETDLEAWKQTMKAADWAELAGHESLPNQLLTFQMYPNCTLKTICIMFCLYLVGKRGVWAR